ncbi:glucosyltransferase [Rickenella mellea]|uniref:Dol-P-Glc:Glc(2)Man(9)GlcNAc(2)-PP-Dol alpha-1,2-glucosyltransferase n=1 Tax=Rickenella mellea TaxID=50990 RepID=A0A4Y7QM85_9AGAM|nr:glucosyltransferase [Rickenella mellea]
MSALAYSAFVATNVWLLKELNSHVHEPYMDEPFHIPQAQAYCRDEWTSWDPKITTPPGLYVLSYLLKRIFLVKCELSMLRLTPLLALLSLPIVLTRLLSYHKRIRPPSSLLPPSYEALVVTAFPIDWFFGFLYYTDVPSLFFVCATVFLALEGRHTLAGLCGAISCTFRQTNIVWVLYAFAYSQVTVLRFPRPSASGPTVPKLHDVPASSAGPMDIIRSILTIPRIVPDILRPGLPYAFDLILFGGFVVWNGGIVLGDKSNHMPSMHIPQVYYFIGFATLFGWPLLASYPGGVFRLVGDIRSRMRIITSIVLSSVVGVTIHLFTIHHPFLLSDNRHYTFYVWRRIFRFHWVVPYLFAPGYLVAGHAWFLRIGAQQSLLQTLVLPVCMLPTLLLTPLLEPRYFLIPYILLRVQVTDIPDYMLTLEFCWYTLINAVTMYVFLYMEREDVGRFMW